MEIIKTNLNFNSNYSIRSLNAINEIILHHSGVSVLQAIDIIHNYHKITRGYAGIGYHFYIRKNGKIYEGRPLNMVGAHAYNHNNNSIGICFEGNFNEEKPTNEQINSGRELITFLKQNYKITSIKAHRDVCVTSCPRCIF